MFHRWRRPRTKRSESEIIAEVRGEANASTQCQSRGKKGYMANIYLTYSDEEAIVDVVNDHEELYNKTQETIKVKARKNSLWERFASSRKPHNEGVQDLVQIPKDSLWELNSA